VHYALERIREGGCRAGLALNPGTPAGAVAELLPSLEVVLCMSVDPGWGGQRFIGASLDKLRRLRALMPDDCLLEVDGGIDLEHGPRAARAGAGVLVAGSAVFGTADPAASYRALAAAVGAG
jgi:ribulose-phosphate 3-epimerase